MKKVLGMFLVLGMLAFPALADTVGPGGTFNGTTFGELKTPPLQNSEFFAIPVSYHASAAYTNWGGCVFAAIYDVSEINYVGVTGIPGGLAVTKGGPFIWGTSGGITTQAGVSLSFWAPGAFASGMSNGPVSSPFQLGWLTIHATGTDGVNSDVDMTFFTGWGWNIWHSTGVTTPFAWTATGSQLVYVGFTTGGAGTIPDPMNRPAVPGEGTWYHVGTGEQVWVVNSGFFASATWFAPSGTVGVEHLPEPAAGLLLLAGAGTLFVARRRRA